MRCEFIFSSLSVFAILNQYVFLAKRVGAEESLSITFSSNGKKGVLSSSAPDPLPCFSRNGGKEGGGGSLLSFSSSYVQNIFCDRWDRSPKEKRAEGFLLQILLSWCCLPLFNFMVSVVVISKHFLLEVAFLEELRSFLFVFKGETEKCSLSIK